MTMITSIAAAAATGAGPNPLITIIPWILIFVIFWMFMIRPQQKRAKEHQASIMAVKKGDRVVTGGGLIGKVTKVSDTEVEVDLGGGLKVMAVKSTLSQVGDGTAAAKPAND
nr:preprotein translocase subunit YajC [uncultured Sphingomonas sp.]